MSKKISIEELFGEENKLTDEEISAIEAHNDKVRKKRQLRSYCKAAIQTFLITAAFWLAAITHEQKIIALMLGATLGIAFRYRARLGYHGHQPHIGLLVLVSLIVSIILVAIYLAQYIFL